MIKYSLILLILCGISRIGNAQKKSELIFPSVEFNAVEAAQILDGTGTSSVNGHAMLNGKAVGYFMEVSLFPVTDYLKEYLELEKTYGKKGKKRASISEEALSYRILTKVDANNESSFEFTGLKPGKYYVEGYLNIAKEKKGATFEGQESYTFEGNSIAGSPIFKEFSYNKFHGYFISGMVEITNDGEAVSITITN